MRVGRHRQWLGLVEIVSAGSVPPGAVRGTIERNMVERVQDVLRTMMSVVSSETKVGDGSPRPCDRVDTSTASVCCVGTDIIYSETGCGRGRDGRSILAGTSVCSRLLLMCDSRRPTMVAATPH